MALAPSHRRAVASALLAVTVIVGLTVAVPASDALVPRTSLFVSPDQNLRSGDVVTVSGTGFDVPPQTVSVGQCVAGATSLVDDCAHVIVFDVPAGANFVSFTIPYRVRRTISPTSSRAVDCGAAPGACAIVATLTNNLQRVDAIAKAISFAPRPGHRP